MRPRPIEALVRGLRKRCPRCGTRAPFIGYFRLDQRCPRCGVQFAREEGFWAGVYLINYGVTALLLVATLFVVILVYAASDRTGSTWPYFAIGGGIAVLFPLWFYPRATTTWVALDLLLRPLEPDEEAEAATYAATREEHGDE